MAGKIYTLTEGDVSVLWNRDVQPRKVSGIVGQRTFNIQVNLPQLRHILDKIKSSAVEKKGLAKDLLTYLDFKFEAPATAPQSVAAPQKQVAVAVADTSKTDVVNTYIMARLGQGATEDQAVAELKAQGWTDEALAPYIKPSAPAIPPLPPAPKQ